MNRDSQRRRIRRFLKGKGRRDIDAFCIYQWIDRCHYEAWWDLALALAPNLPPNSLNHDYHKRLEFLLSESRRKLKSLKEQSIKISTAGGATEFLIPKSFWETCQDLGLGTKGKSKSGLRFELAGQKILFVQNTDLKGCVIKFYKMDTERLVSWLNSHGFGHLVQRLIVPKKAGQGENAKLRISWQDAENLMPSIIAELENDGTILPSMFLEAIGKVKNGTWPQYVNYVKKKYSIRVSDEVIERTRKVLIEIASGLEGSDQFVKRLQAD